MSRGRAALCLCGLIFAAIVTQGCGRKKGAQVTLLSPEQRFRSALELLQKRKLNSAIAELGKVDLSTADDRQAMEPRLRLALADATYYQGTDIAFIDARSLYLDFVTLYADHPSAPYAQFQAGMCSLAQVNHPSKDQSQTLQAIGTLSVVERRFPASPFAGAARLMRKKAESNLAEHEFLIGRFYFKKKAYLAAIERFRRVLDLYPAYFEKEKLYFYLGQALARGNNPAEGRIYLDKLVTDYPEGKYTKQAGKVLNDLALQLDVDGSP